MLEMAWGLTILVLVCMASVFVGYGAIAAGYWLYRTGESWCIAALDDPKVRALYERERRGW